jgi:hypothetical protein
MWALAFGACERKGEQELRAARLGLDVDVDVTIDAMLGRPWAA